MIVRFCRVWSRGVCNTPLRRRIYTIYLSNTHTRGRGVLHTPHKNPARDEWMLLKSKNDCPFSLGMIEGRMQYAPTWKHSYHLSIRYVHPYRVILHTPHKPPARYEQMAHEPPNDYPFLLGMIDGRMQYAPTRSHMYPKPPIVSDNDAHLYLKFFVVSDNNKCLFQKLNIVSIDDRYIAQSFIIASINNK